MKENEVGRDENAANNEENFEDNSEHAASILEKVLDKISTQVGDDEQEPSTSGIIPNNSEETTKEVNNFKESMSPNNMISRPSTSTYEMYKVLHSIIQSETELPCVPSNSPPPKYYRTPPSYSAVMRMGPLLKDTKKGLEVDSSKIFSRAPPPSYAEVEGIWSDLPRANSSEEVLFGPDPVYMVCPHCSAIVITETYTQRSAATHLSALALCLFGCWPCCLLPYFMDSCKNTYHHCPVCNYFFGSYHPW